MGIDEVDVVEVGVEGGEAWDEGGEGIVFGGEEEDGGGRVGMGLAGEGEAGGDSCREIEGEEGFADAGITGEEGDFAFGDAVGPEPGEGCGSEAAEGDGGAAREGEGAWLVEWVEGGDGIEGVDVAGDVGVGLHGLPWEGGVEVAIERRALMSALHKKG